MWQGVARCVMARCNRVTHFRNRALLYSMPLWCASELHVTDAWQNRTCHLHHLLFVKNSCQTQLVTLVLRKYIFSYRHRVLQCVKIPWHQGYVVLLNDQQTPSNQPITEIWCFVPLQYCRIFLPVLKKTKVQKSMRTVTKWGVKCWSASQNLNTNNVTALSTDMSQQSSSVSLLISRYKSPISQLVLIFCSKKTSTNKQLLG